MIKLLDLLNENSTSKYEYGCVMLEFNFLQFKNIQSNIEEDIYIEKGDKTYGLEDEAHITLLYGLHKEVTLEQVKSKLDYYKFGPEGILLNNISCFNSKKYDVLKFDAKGEILHEMNEDLRSFPYTSDFPEYHPHLTIGYLKPGKGKIYTQGFKGLKFEIFPKNIIYSQVDGTKNKIKIEINGKQ